MSEDDGYTQQGLWTHSPKYKTVYEYIKSRGKIGATRDEIAAAGIAVLQTVCPAVLELIHVRAIVETKRTRLTRQHRPARVLIVWERKKRSNDK